MVRTVFQRLVSRPLIRLASFALLAPLPALSIAPAATFAATPSPDRGVIERLGAQVHVGLTLNPATPLSPGAAFTYDLSVMNSGPGVAAHTRVTVPLDPNIAIDDFTSSNTGMYVQYLDASSITIQFGDLDPGESGMAQIFAHVLSSAPATLSVGSRATATWDDSAPDKTSLSNDAAVRVGVGALTPAQPALDLGVSAPVDAGTALTVQGAGFGSKEPVSFWINLPTGAAIPAESLGQTDTAVQGTVVALDAPGMTDDQGGLIYTLSTDGLPSGTYSLVAHGITSGVEEVGSFTIK